MPVKMSMLLQVTTTATDPSSASAHTGGWSESLWSPGNAFITLAALDSLLSARRNLLPAGASIVGIRQGLYTISGNKLLPQGTSGFKVLYPGNASFTVNLPQDSLELSGQSSTSINANRWRIGCLPDEMIVKGEYTPTSVYKGYLTSYRANILAGNPIFGFVGRVLSNPALRVLSVTPGVGGAATVVLSGALGAVLGTSYVRFHRVYNDVNEPVKGTFLVQTFTAPATYTISGYTGGTVSKANGTARIDAVDIFAFGSITFGRAVVKKIGRPFEQYRGRQSKRN